MIYKIVADSLLTNMARGGFCEVFPIHGITNYDGSLIVTCDRLYGLMALVIVIARL